VETLFEKEKNGLGVITVKVNRQDYQVDFDKEAKKIAKQIDIKGFRQGKVPPELVKKMYGANLRNDIVSKKVNQTIDDYIQANQISIAGSPFIKKDQPLLDTEEIEKGKTAEVKFHVILLPELTLEIDNSITISYKAPQVEEKDIEKKIKSLREREAQTENLSEVTNQASISAFAIALEGEDKFKHLGFLEVNKFAPAYQEKLIGLKSGDTIQLPLVPSYADEEELYYAFGLEKQEDKDFLASNEVNLQINRIYKRVLPELNQKFFDSFSTESEPIQNEADFRAVVKKMVIDDYAGLAERSITKAIEEYLYSHISTDLQIEVVKEYFKASSKQDNEFSLKLKDTDEMQKIFDDFKKIVILEMISKKFAIEVTQEEIYQEATSFIYQMYSMYRMPINANDMPKIVYNYLTMENGKNQNQIFYTVKRNKTIDLIKQKITLIPEYVSYDEYIKNN